MFSGGAKHVNSFPSPRPRVYKKNACGCSRARGAKGGRWKTKKAGELRHHLGTVGKQGGPVGRSTSRQKRQDPLGPRAQKNISQPQELSNWVLGATNRQRAKTATPSAAKLSWKTAGGKVRKAQESCQRNLTFRVARQADANLESKQLFLPYEEEMVILHGALLDNSV
jgi:hypothetical protein